MLNLCNKRSFNDLCSLFFLIVLAILSIYPVGYTLNGFNAIVTVSTIGWFLFSFLGHARYFIYPNSLRLLMFTFLIYTIGFAFISGNVQTSYQYIEMSQLVLFYLAYDLNRLNKRDADSIFVIKLTIPFIFATNISTIVALLENPLVSRAAQKGGENINLFRAGVGGYEFIYFSVFISIIAFAALLYARFNTKHKIIVSSILILCCLTVILSNFATAAAMLLVGICLLLIFYYFDIFAVPVLFALVMGVLAYGEQLSLLAVEFLLDVVGISTTASRALEVINYLYNSEFGAALSEREGVYTISVRLFLENPLFGVLWDFGFDGINGDKIGRHSNILDAFALYGVVIGFVQLFFYISPIYSRLRNIDGSISFFSILVVVLFLINFSLNTGVTSVGLAVFFIYPVVFDMIQHNKSLDTAYKKFYISINFR